MLVETRCRHDMLEWPDLGYTSCATCKGHNAAVDTDSDTPDLVTDIDSILKGIAL